MKLKKTIALLLASLTIFAAFCGCKKELPPDEDQETTTISDSDQPQELVPEENAKIKFRTGDEEFGKAIAKLFEEKYEGITVEIEKGGLYDTTKLALELPSGKGPDVYMAPHDKTYECYLSGLELELDPQIAKRLSNEVSDVAMKTVTLDGKVVAVPVSIETYVLFYNKNLVEGEPISTFEELKQQCEENNDISENKFWYLGEVATGSPFYTMVGTYGFNLFGNDGIDEENPGFDTPEFLKGLEVVKAYSELMPIPSGDLGNTDFLTTEFTTDKTAYLMGGPWSVKTFRDENVNFGVTALPTFDGHQQRSFAFVQNAHISPYSKYPIASQLFAEFLVSPEAAKELYYKAAKITSRKDTSTIDGLKDDAEFTAIAKAFSTSIPMPSAKRISYFWTISTNIASAVFDGQMTPEQAVKKALEDWEAFVSME